MYRREKTSRALYIHIFQHSLMSLIETHNLWALLCIRNIILDKMAIFSFFFLLPDAYFPFDYGFFLSLSPFTSADFLFILNLNIVNTILWFHAFRIWNTFLTLNSAKDRTHNVTCANICGLPISYYIILTQIYTDTHHLYRVLKC